MLSASARVSGHPLLSFKVDIHECLEVVEIERDAVVPGTVQFKEETRGKGRNRRTNGGSAAGMTVLLARAMRLTGASRSAQPLTIENKR